MCFGCLYDDVLGFTRWLHDIINGYTTGFNLNRNKFNLNQVMGKYSASGAEKSALKIFTETSYFPNPDSAVRLTRLLRSIMVMLAITAIAGCTTHYGVARFQSSPAGVQVFDMDDGSVIGVTPVDFTWRSKDAKRKFMNVRMHKDGYQDAIKSFWLRLDYRSPEKASSNPQLVQFELNKGS